MALGREHARTARGIAVRRQPRDGRAALLEALQRVAADPEIAPEALTEERGGHGVGVGVDGGSARRARGAARSSSPERCAASAALRMQVHQARAGRAHVLGHAVPQLDRALVVACWPRRRRRAASASAPASADAENAAGRLWAANQWKASSAVTPLGETDSAGSASSAAAQRGVQRPALAGEQVVGQRLAHERVAEAVGAGLGLDDDHVVRHCLAQCRRRARRTGMSAARSSSPWLTRGPATAASRSTAAWRARAPPTRSMRASARLAGSARRPRRPQLLGEERVALGAGEEFVDQARLGPAAEDPRQLGDHLVAREALEADALDDRRALGLGHQRRNGWRRCSSSVR